ncbi:MAG: gluconate 2-dehydrogenase subunit 3 family protein [Bryobacterales bacterium]|nr:gluconate 2-dehydrogenase subunit 3 family protein [Bryobacterales bacterium]
MKSRRQALRAAASAVAALPVLGQHQHSPATTDSAAPYKARWATAGEMHELAEAADLIIPRTDTPGASDAKVQEYIDYALSGDPKRQAVIRAGLKWLRGVPADKRAAALQTASENPRTPNGRFFQLMKELTIDGYYQSREGLAGELGWKGNTYLPEFKGCTHPEHKG